MVQLIWCLSPCGAGTLNPQHRNNRPMNQPWTGNTPQSAVPRLNISPNAPYYMMHHPAQWELVIENDTAEWLPTFSTLYEIAGVNGVQSTPAGPDSTMARVHYMDKGY